MKVEINLEKLADFIVESEYLLLENSRFNHAIGCKNVSLVREIEIKDGMRTTTRLCSGCGHSDIVKTNIVSRIF